MEHAAPLAGILAHFTSNPPERQAGFAELRRVLLPFQTPIERFDRLFGQPLTLEFADFTPIAAVEVEGWSVELQPEQLRLGVRYLLVPNILYGELHGLDGYQDFRYPQEFVLELDAWLGRNNLVFRWVAQESGRELVLSQAFRFGS